MAAILQSCMEASYYTSGFFRSWACLAFFVQNLKSCMHSDYRSVKHTVMITWANWAERLHQIRRYNNSPPYVTVKMNDSRPIAVTRTGVKKRPDSHFYFPWLITKLLVLLYTLTYWCERKRMPLNSWYFRAQQEHILPGLHVESLSFHL